MTGRTTIHLAILALSAIALPMVGNCQYQEPMSGGKPLSYWLGRLDDRSDSTARAAIREMGTNALPDLIRMLQQSQPEGDKSRTRALNAIVCLGPAGQPALPEILPLVTNQNQQLKIWAFFAIRAIGPETESVKPVLPALFQSLGDPDWTMRSAGIMALAALRPSPPEAASTYVRLLTDSNRTVREEAMRCLVAQTNAAALPMLNKQLNDKDSYVVTLAAINLAAFGPAAAGSAPRLKQLLDDPLITVRVAATNALDAIAGQPHAHATAEARAGDSLSFNFPAIPLTQFLENYERLAGKKVTMPATLNSRQTIELITLRPLTKSESLQLFEEVLKQQAGLIIIHGPDGSLSVPGPTTR